MRQLRWNILNHLRSAKPSPVLLAGIFKEARADDETVAENQVRAALGFLVKNGLARRLPPSAAGEEAWLITSDGLTELERPI